MTMEAVLVVLVQKAELGLQTPFAPQSAYCWNQSQDLDLVALGPNRT